MQTYILGIVGAVLISAVVTMIAPGGKMGKFVKGAMKLFTLVVLVSPFVGWLQSGKITLEKGTVGEDKGYYAACAEMLERSDEREIAGELRENFGVETEVSVARKPDATFALQKILVKISDSGISGQVEHKDKSDRVQAYLNEKYGDIAEVS